jgi:hypothetical protein
VARIKGTAVRARLDYLAARFGETGLQRVLDELSAELHAEIADGVVVSAWYPLELSEAILGAAERLLGKGDGSLCEAIELSGIKPHTPWLCHVLVGYIAGHVEVLGGYNVRVVHVSCVLRRGSRCQWDASWQTAPT